MTRRNGSERKQEERRGDAFTETEVIGRRNDANSQRSPTTRIDVLNNKKHIFKL